MFVQKVNTDTIHSNLTTFCLGESVELLLGKFTLRQSTQQEKEDKRDKMFMYTT